MVKTMDCDECHGSGIAFRESKMKLCPKCLGDGQVDWLTNITGVSLSEAEISTRLCDVLIKEGKRIHGFKERRDGL